MFVWGSLVRGNSARGNTAGDIIALFCAGLDVGGRSGSASALSGILSGTIKRSCASHRTSGATQRTCNYASARGKCTAAPTNTQWHRQPGGTFRATYTALHQRREVGHYSPPRECVALRRVRLHLQRLRRKPCGEGEQTEGPEHFQGGYEPPPSGTT